jgi:hypothetical protein
LHNNFFAGTLAASSINWSAVMQVISIHQVKKVVIEDPSVKGTDTVQYNHRQIIIETDCGRIAIDLFADQLESLNAAQ